MAVDVRTQQNPTVTDTGKASRYSSPRRQQPEVEGNRAVPERPKETSWKTNIKVGQEGEHAGNIRLN